MRRRAAGQPQLAAEVAVAFQQRDAVAVASGLDGGGDAGRAAADHEHVAAGRARNGTRQRPLPAGARVDDARDRRARVVVADAALVAADAVQDLVGPAGDGLRDQVGVGDHRPRHADHVGLPVGQQPLGVVEIDHAGGGDHRHAGQRGADGAGRLGDRVALDRRRRHDADRAHQRRGVAEREVDEVDQAVAAEAARDPRAGRRAERAGRALRRRPGGRRRRPGRRLPPDGGEHVARESQAVLQVVLVVTEVRHRREELRAEIAVRHRHLEAVDAALAGLCGAVGEGGEQVGDVAPREGAGLDVEPRGRHGGRGDGGGPRRRRDALPSTVEQLQEQARAVRPERVADAAVDRDHGGVEAGDRVRRQETGLVHAGGLDEDRRRAAAGARLLVGQEVVGGHAVVDEVVWCDVETIRLRSVAGPSRIGESSVGYRSLIAPGARRPARRRRPSRRACRRSAGSPERRCRPGTAASAARRGRA